MTQATARTPTVEPRSAPTPPLENGDHLTVEEFERRYAASSHIGKAELIDGVVYLSSTADQYHAEPNCDLVVWLGLYMHQTPGVRAATNGTLRLGPRNRPQPDGHLRVRPAHGGQTRTDAEGFAEGPPELITEVAASSASYDLHPKKDVYSRHGVREYVVWRVYDAALDWFVLRGGQFERLVPDEKGILKSEVFQGLWLDGSALLREDHAAVRKALEEGLSKPEHAAFVRRLAEAAGSK